MAHTNETVNYHLSQFVGTDIPNPLVDYNGDMSKIDTAIKNVADSAVSEGGRITALETQNGNEVLTTTAQTLSGAVNEIDSEVGGIDTRLTTAEGKIVTDEGTLSTAVSNISTLAGKVSNLETKVGTAVLTTTASDCSGAINELDAEDGVLAGKITALETQNGNAVLITTAQTLSGAINELASAPAGSVSAADVSFDGTVSGLSATNVQNAIDEVVQDIPVIPSTYDADDIVYDNTTSGLSATNVQDAIDEVNGNINSAISTALAGLQFEYFQNISVSWSNSNTSSTQVSAINNGNNHIATCKFLLALHAGRVCWATVNSTRDTVIWQTTQTVTATENIDLLCMY